MEEKNIYQFTNEEGQIERVFCTYNEYLYLKLSYGVGLTFEEYQSYKQN